MPVERCGGARKRAMHGRRVRRVTASRGPPARSARPREREEQLEGRRVIALRSAPVPNRPLTERLELAPRSQREATTEVSHSTTTSPLGRSSRSDSRCLRLRLRGRSTAEPEVHHPALLPPAAYQRAPTFQRSSRESSSENPGPCDQGAGEQRDDGARHQPRHLLWRPRQPGGSTHQQQEGAPGDGEGQRVERGERVLRDEGPHEVHLRLRRSHSVSRGKL